MSELQFDKATYDKGLTRPPCSACKRPLVDEYWQWQQHTLCSTCRQGVEATLTKARSSASFGKALLLGGGAAFGCGIAYAIFAGLTHMQLALITIGIAFVVAKVVRKASGGIGGRKFQVLAVALTYVASAMGYFPDVWKGLANAAEHHAAAEVAPAAPSSSAASAIPPPAASVPSERQKAPITVAGVLLAFALVFGITLAAPFLSITEAPIGVLIVVFGLWEAWRLSRALPVKVLGPFRVTPLGAHGPGA